MTHSPSSETPDILDRLQDESMRLCGRSISRGDLDSGLASNLADAAIYEIERLRGLADQLNFVVSSGHAQRSADETLRRKMEEIHDITQDTTLNVECWQKLQNIAATAASALSDTSTDRPPIRELSVGATTDKPASDRLASLPSGESDPSVMLGSTEAGTPSDSSTGRKAPASCPHCYDETDCSNVEICNAIGPVTSPEPNSPVGWGGHLPGKIEP